MSLEDVTSGLVLCCLAVEYISFSKRFCPELINFLLGVLHLAVQDKTSTGTAFLLMGYCHISSSTRPNWLLIFSIRVGVVSILIQSGLMRIIGINGYFLN